MNIACSLRSIVAILSAANLKEYLKRAIAVLPTESSLKPIIVREILDNENLTGIKETLQKLKEIIKGYEVTNRKPFQLIILDPIRAFNDKTKHFNPTDMNILINQQKETLQKTEKELSQAQKQIREDKTIPFPKVLASK